MKKLKAKTKPAKALAVKPVKVKSIAPQFVRPVYSIPANSHPGHPAETPDWLPTPEQIATIGATLARNRNDSPDALADFAIRLWFAARARIIAAAFNLEIWEQDVELEQKYPYEGNFFEPSLSRKMKEWKDLQLEQEKNPYGDKLFDPKLDRFPVTRDDFLRKLLPQYKNRAADLERIAKAFISDTLRQARYVTGREPTPELVDKVYGSWNPCENAARANSMVKAFCEWYLRYVEGTRRAAGQKSATERKLKKTP